MSIGTTTGASGESSGSLVARFASLAQFRDEHDQLLRRYQDADEPLGLVEEIKRFIARGAATGILLKEPRDRVGAQRYLSYWGTVLARLTDTEPPDISLEPAQDDFARRLEDDEFPYPGIDALRADQGAHLVRDGKRAEFLDACLKTLRERRCLIIVGPSGSGRLSAVQAGIVPTLTAALQKEGKSSRVLPVVTPGEAPLDRLAEAIRGSRPPDRRWVQQTAAALRRDRGQLLQVLNTARLLGQGPSILVVADLEQILTLAEHDAHAFVENLVAMLHDSAAGHFLVMTLRADMELAVREHYKQLKPLLHECRQAIPPFSSPQLRAMIAEPAADVGLQFSDPGIVDQLVFDVQGDPTAPLLTQCVMQHLWEKREPATTRNTITWQAYHRFGGGRRALESMAESFEAALSPEEQKTLPGVFDHLVRAGDLGRHPTLIRALLQLVQRVARNRLREILDRLQQPLSPPEPTLRPTDPAQLDAREAPLLDKLRRTAMVRHSPASRPDHAEFILAHRGLVQSWPSLAAWVRKVQREEARLRTTGASIVFGTLIVVLVFLTAGALLGWLEAWRAQRSEHATAQTTQQQFVMQLNFRGRNALEQGDLSSSLVWFARANLEALKLDRGAGDAMRELNTASIGAGFAQSSLLAAICYEPNAKWISISADRRRVVIVSGATTGPSGPTPGKIAVWDVATADDPKRIPLDHDTHQGEEVGVATFSPDGTKLAVVLGRGEDALRVYDVATGTLQATIAGKYELVCFRVGDPRRLIAVVAPPPGTGEVYRSIQVLDLDTRKPAQDQGPFPNVKVLETYLCDGCEYLYCVIKVDERQQPALVELCADLADSLIRVAADYASGVTKWTPAVGDVSPRNGCGRLLVTAGLAEVPQSKEDHNAIQFWTIDRSTHPPQLKLDRRQSDFPYFTQRSPNPTPPQTILGLTISPHEDFVIACGDHGAVSRPVFDPRNPAPGPRSKPLEFPHAAQVFHAGYSADGRYLLTSSRDRSVRVWDLATGQASRYLATPALRHGATVGAAWFSRDGEHVITACPDDSLVRIWRLRPGGLAARTLPTRGNYVDEALDQLRFTTHDNAFLSVTYNGDAAPQDPRLEPSDFVQAWDVHDGSALTQPIRLPDKIVVTATFDRNTRLTATVCRGDTVAVWDRQGMRPAAQPKPDPATWVGFRPGTAGQLVLLRPRPGGGQTLTRWYSDARIDEESLLQLDPSEYAVQGRFSPSGRYFLAICKNPQTDRGSVLIWDFEKNERVPVSKELEHGEPITDAAIHDRGLVVTSSTDDTSYFYDITSKKLLHEHVHTGDVLHCAITRDFGAERGFAATASADQTVIVWEVQRDANAEITVKPWATFAHARRSLETVSTVAPPIRLYEVSFSADGSRLATAGSDGSVRIWDVQSKRLVTLLHHPEPAARAMFCDDGPAGDIAVLCVPALLQLSGKQPPGSRIQLFHWALTPAAGAADHLAALVSLQASRTAGDVDGDLLRIQPADFAKQWGAVRDSTARRNLKPLPTPPLDYLAGEAEALGLWRVALWHLARELKDEKLPPERRTQLQTRSAYLRLKLGLPIFGEIERDNAFAFLEAAAKLAYFKDHTPELAQAWLALGDQCRAHDELPRALVAYTHAMKVEPSNWDGVAKRGRLYRVQGDWPNAAADLEQAAHLQQKGNPSVPADALWRESADAYVMAQKWRKAADALERVQQPAGDDTLNVARALARADAWAKAQAKLEQVINQDPLKHSQLHQATYRYLALVQQKRLLQTPSPDLPANAHEEFCVRVLKQFGAARIPEIASAAAWVCVLGPVAGNADQVVALAGVGYVVNKQSSTAATTYGAALYRAEQYRRAQEVLLTATDQGIARPQTLLFLALTYQRQGKPAEAAEALARADKAARDQIAAQDTELLDSNAFWDRLEIEVLRAEARQALGR